jgi:hypothetical protein
MREELDKFKATNKSKGKVVPGLNWAPRHKDIGVEV